MNSDYYSYSSYYSSELPSPSSTPLPSPLGGKTESSSSFIIPSPSMNLNNMRKTSKSYPNNASAIFNDFCLGNFQARDFNQEFQQCIEKFFSAKEKDMIDITKEMTDIVQDFVHEAKTFGAIIIEELFLPLEQKSIKPVTEAVGGIAGGEKYFAGGIFFKFAIDTSGLYFGDNEIVMKVSSHEMKGMMALMGCMVKGLHVPLIVLLDYRGYRLVAESFLPLENNSLIYGSRDAGRTVHCSHKNMNLMIEACCKSLNLSPHSLTTSENQHFPIWGPVDMEGHLGADGRYYVLDAARLFPPVIPNGQRCSHLYRLMRPEFVKQSPYPLCSDGFSRFLKHDKQKIENDLCQATFRLETDMINEFSRTTLDTNMCWSQNITLDGFDDIVTAMHRKGINLRYLGLVRAACTNFKVKNLLLMEAVARTMKKNLLAKLREVKAIESERYNTVIANYLNLLFYRRDGDYYWHQFLKSDLNRRFMNILTVQEMNENYVLRHHFPLDLLLDRLQAITGILLKTNAHGVEFTDSGEYFLHPITHDTITDVLPVVKYPHTIHFAQATALGKIAHNNSKGFLEKNTLEIGERSKLRNLFRKAAKKYKESLQVSPADSRTLHNYGLSLQSQAFLATTEEEAAEIFAMAESVYQEALKVHPHDAFALLLWGNLFLERSKRTKNSSTRVEQLKLAIFKYEESHLINPDHFDLLYNWGTALLYLSKCPPNDFNQNETTSKMTYLKKACHLFSLAAKIKAGCDKTHRNWGVCLYNMAKLSQGTKAEQFYEDGNGQFEIAVGNSLSKYHKGDARLYEVYFNWGNGLYSYGRMQQKRSGKAWDSLALYVSSCAKFSLACQEKSHPFDALYNWGKMLICMNSLDVGLARTIDEKNNEKENRDASTLSSDTKLIHLQTLRNETIERLLESIDMYLKVLIPISCKTATPPLTTSTSSFRRISLTPLMYFGHAMSHKKVRMVSRTTLKTLVHTGRKSISKKASEILRRLATTVVQPKGKDEIFQPQESYSTESQHQATLDSNCSTNIPSALKFMGHKNNTTLLLGKERPTIISSEKRANFKFGSWRVLLNDHGHEISPSSSFDFDQ